MAKRLAMGSALKLKPPPGRMRPAVEERHRCHGNFFRHQNDTVFPASSATSIGCPGGLPAVTMLTVCGTVS